MPETANVFEFAPSPLAVKDLERLGEGRQAELFAWPSGGVVKLFRSRDVAPAQMEAGLMQVLAPAGLPMPRMFGAVTIEQRPGIVMERLVGPDQLTILGRKPWTVWAVGRALGQLHAQLHTAVAPEGLCPLRPSLRQQLEASDVVPSPIRALALADLDRLADGAEICHWDFHPGNVIETASGPRIIDWPNVHRGDRLADVARTLLILQSGALPPGAPLLVRKLTAVGRNVLGRRYLSEYRRRLPFKPCELEAWTRVSLASRLSYGLGEEREHLLHLISRL